MSIVKLASYNSELRKKHLNLSESQHNQLLDRHEKNYLKPLARLAKQEGIKDPTVKAVKGAKVGAGVGAVTGAALGSLTGKSIGGKVFGGLVGTILGTGAGAGLGINYGRQERRYLHAKYPKLKSAYDNYDTEFEEVWKNRPE